MNSINLTLACGFIKGVLWWYKSFYIFALLHANVIAFDLSLPLLDWG